MQETADVEYIYLSGDPDATGVDAIIDLLEKYGQIGDVQCLVSPYDLRWKIEIDSVGVVAVCDSLNGWCLVVPRSERKLVGVLKRLSCLS